MSCPTILKKADVILFQQCYQNFKNKKMSQVSYIFPLQKNLSSLSFNISVIFCLSFTTCIFYFSASLIDGVHVVTFASCAFQYQIFDFLSCQLLRVKWAIIHLLHAEDHSSKNVLFNEVSDMQRTNDNELIINRNHFKY